MLPRIRILNIVNSIDKELTILETEFLYQIVGIRINLAARSRERLFALTSTFGIIGKVVLLSIIMHFQVVANGGEVVENLLLDIVFVSVVPGAVFFEIGRKLFIDRKLIHNRMQRYEKAREGYTKGTNNQRSSGKPTINEKAQKKLR